MSVSDNYLDTIKLCCTTFAQPACQESISQHSTISYRVTSYLAAAEGWLYHVGRGERHAQQAARYLEILAEEGTIGCFGLHAAIFAYELIQPAGVFSTEAETVVIEAFVQGCLARTGYEFEEARDFGLPINLVNHNTLAAAGAQQFLHLFADHPQALQIRQLADDVYNQWWARPDDLEITTCYTPLTRTSMMRLAQLRGTEAELYAHPVVKEAFERYLHEITPLGAISKFGDTGWNETWAFWIAILEKAAQEYQDGRFKWAAQRMYEYSVNYGYREALANVPALLDEELSVAHGGMAAHCMRCYGLVLASRWAAEEVEPVAPQRESRINYLWLGDGHLQPRLGERRALRLILRGGWEPQSPFMALGLLRSMNLRYTGHNHDDATAITTYTAEGAILLQDSGYFWKSPRFKNLLWARAPQEDFLGLGTPDRPGFDAEVTMLREHDRVTFAQVSSPHHLNLPLRETRTILFPHDGRVAIIHDHVDNCDQCNEWRVGPVYHSSRIVAQGESFFDLAQDAPSDTDYSLLWENPAVNLLVAFGPGSGELGQGRPEVDLSCWDGYPEPAWIPKYMASGTQPQAVFQHRVLKSGESRDFISVLVPHPSDTPAEQILAAMQLTGLQHGGWHLKIGDVEIVVNPARHYFNSGELVSDAHLLYLDRSKDEPYVAFEAARYITADGRPILKTSGRINRVSGQLPGRL